MRGSATTNVIPAERVRVRADYDVIELRKRVHRQSQLARLEAEKLHASFKPDIKRVAKSDWGAVLKTRAYVKVGREFHAEFERTLKKRVNEAMYTSAEGALHIVDMMLPERMKPPGYMGIPDYWNLEFKGATPEERLARARLKTRKKMQSIMTRKFREAPALTTGMAEEQLAGEAWNGVYNYAMSLASNEPWVAGLVAAAYTYDTNTEVIDHYEHLSTLDDRTCDECAALDGQLLPTTDESTAYQMVNIHPMCRCTVVPVSKTWKELGLDGVEEPEGTRIARTDPIFDASKASPKAYRDPSTGDIFDKYRPGLEPIGGNQYYVPASMRYKDWMDEQVRLLVSQGGP